MKKKNIKEKELNNNKNNIFSNLKDKVLEFAKTKKGRIIILSSLFSLFVLITIWNIMFVKVTFNTDGGDKMKSIYIMKNSVLDEKYKATKVGHVFVNWQYSEGDSLFYDNEKIKNDITLVATYNEIPEAGYVDTRLDNVEIGAKIVVHSLLELKDDNIDKYFSVKDGMDNLMKLNVESLKDDKYEITSKEGWLAGFVYQAEILSLENIEFVSIGKQDVSSNSKKVFFDIYKANVSEIEYSEETKTAAKSDLVSLKEKSTIKVNNASVKTYIANVKNSDSYKVGDVILFGIDTADGKDDAYYVVIGKTSGGLELRQATFEDVYDEVEFYHKEDIDFSQGGINYEQVANKIKDELYKDQKGLVVLTNMYIEGAYNTKQVLNTLENPSEKELNEMITASKLASIPKDMIHVTISPSADDNGMIKLKLVIEVKAVSLDLGNKGEINISFKIEEQIGVSLLVIYDLDEGWDDWFKYTGLDLLNKFSMSFTVKLQTKDGDTVELGKDVEEFLINAVNSGHGKYDWVDEINNQHIMENTFDYIPIIEKEIFSKMFWFGLASVDLKLEGVVSVGAEAAISAQYTISSYYQVGSTNGYFADNGNEIHVYDDGRTESWNRRGVFESSFDLSLKGAVGVRGGVRLSASVSALGMNDLYSIGLSLEGGVYLELTGFVNLSIKTQQARETKSTVNGGVNIEAGIYVEVDFIWNCWPFGMDSKDDINLAQMQFPLFEFTSIGNPIGFEYIPSDNSKTNPIKIYTNEINVFDEKLRLGYITMVQYNEKTKKYEPMPVKLNTLWRRVDYYAHDHVRYSKSWSPDYKFEILDSAPDGYVFPLDFHASQYDPITGAEIYSIRKNIWFQYEKPVDDGIYDVKFEVPEDSAFPSYDKSIKTLTFTVVHGEELEFKEIPESYKKDGKTYVFEKWDKEFSGKQAIHDGDVTYIAVFKPETAKYTYTFHAMFGKFKNGKESLIFKDVYHDSKIGDIDIPTRANYTFVGWTTGDVDGGPNVTIKDGFLYDLKGNKIFGDLTVYAIWKEVPNSSTFTLTFDAGDGYVLSGDTGSFVHSVSYKAKKNEEFYNIPIAIKEDTSDPGYYYTDEDFGLNPGFIPNASKTYKANYKRVQRSFDLFISDSTFIKKNGKITYSDDIIANTTDDKWKSGTFNQKLSLPTASVEVDGQTYTTNKYILIAENKQQKPYSISSVASSLKSKYGWSYNTANVTMYGNNTTSIIYDSSSLINYGTIISYYYGSSGFNLKGVSYIEFSAIPYFEIS